MKLTKRDALALSNLFAVHQTRWSLPQCLFELRDSLEAYLLGDHSQISDEELDELCIDEEGANAASFDDDDFVITEDDDNLKKMPFLSASALAKLDTCRAKVIGSSVDDPDVTVALGFAQGKNGRCRLTINTVKHGSSNTVVFFPMMLSRDGSSFSFAEKVGAGNAWHTFHVSKFPRSWTKLLAPNVTYEVK